MGNTNKKLDGFDMMMNPQGAIMHPSITEPQSYANDREKLERFIVNNSKNYNIRPINSDATHITNASNEKNQNATAKPKAIMVYYHAQDNVKIEIPFQNELLTVGWLVNEIERKIKEEKFFDVTSQLLKDKRIVALKCKTSKSECMDYLLTLPLANISFLQDRDILETVLANNKMKRKRKPHLEDFDILKIIGKGGFSNVFHVRRKDDGTIHAMKCLKKSHIKRENKVRHVMNERQILSQVSHPFIVKMEWAFQTEHYLFMILEFCAGGEIFYHMNKVQRFSEKVAKFYFAEIILAIEYLHDNNIFYRDLKPENILLDEEGHVKLADFGISRVNFSERDRSTSFCGSPEYMSPEMLKQGRVHGRSVDFYALGALLFEMLTGLPPHFSENRDEMYRRILHNSVEYPRFLSPMAKSLLKGLLIKNPEQRLGARFGVKEIKDHPFCRDIDWSAVIEKRVLPPIKPSLRYSNFDPDYTSMPVRFTFEEDLVRDTHTRRKSDPGLDNFIGILNQQNTINGHQNPLGGGAFIYPNFAFERKGDISYKGQNHLQYQDKGEINGDQSPQYSRPPSSTFRGYSFMNFRNDSISSVEPQGETPQKPTQGQSGPTQAGLNLNVPNNNLLTHLVRPIGSNIFNIIDDYQFTSSQRSRTISFANQSMLTEGIEQKNIYAMDFQGFNSFFNDICFKANEFEFNAYNQQFTKKLQFSSALAKQYKVEQQRPFQSFIGCPSNPNVSMMGQKAQLPQQVVQLSQQAYFNDAMNNFEYNKDGNPQQQQLQAQKIAEIQDEDDSRRETMQNEDVDESQVWKSKRHSELFIGNLTSKLIQDKDAKIDKFGKNLIRFNDEINNVKSERKRKIDPTQQLKDTIQNQTNRKGAHSLYTNENPLTPESRLRVESNYTTRSGGGNGIMDVSQDRVTTGSQKKKMYKSPNGFQKSGLGFNQRSSSKGIKQLSTNNNSSNNNVRLQNSASQVQKKQTSQHSRFGSQVISPKGTSSSKISSSEPQSVKLSSQAQVQSQMVSPKVTSTRKLYEEKKQMMNTPVQTNNRKLPQQDVQQSNQQSGVKSRNSTSNSASKFQTTSSQQQVSISEKKNANLLKSGQLEQIDEISNTMMLTREQMSKTIVQPSSLSFGIIPISTRKKVSRLSSPKSELVNHIFSKGQAQQQATITTKNANVSNNNNRNRQKTNSHYAATSTHFNEFKNLLSPIDSSKRNPNDGNKDVSASSKNRIPKSQEREKNSNSENTLEDLEDNVDEFKQGEDQLLMKIKNPSLMTSIAYNSTKHQENSKAIINLQSSQSASSSIISHYDPQNQRTPEEMKLVDLTSKASPKQLLGQVGSFLESTPTNSQSLKMPSSRSQFSYSSKTKKEEQEETFPRLAHQHSKSGQQCRPNPYYQSNSRVDSPKISSSKGSQGGRYSFWTVKPSGQKTPNKLDSEKVQDFRMESDQNEYEEVRVERVDTEILGMGVDEKLSLSKSEKKLKKVSNSKQPNSNTKNMVLRLTISQANKNI